MACAPHAKSSQQRTGLASASGESPGGQRTGCRVLCACAAVALVLALATHADAQTAPGDDPPVPEESWGARAAKFLAGGALGLAAHEGGHVIANVAFGATPGLKRVDFHGVPFFAITHHPHLPLRQEFIVASAGFWVQHAGSEWMLTRRPRLRHERAPVAKGLLAFNILTSIAYAGAALARTGPDERDTRGMAVTTQTDERWIGGLVLTPAVLDAWRYRRPDVRWLKWASRAVKVGMVVLVLRNG